MEECCLPHPDRSLAFNADEIAAFTVYLFTSMYAEILGDSIFPAVQYPALADFQIAKYLALALGAFDRKHSQLSKVFRSGLCILASNYELTDYNTKIM
jgi:hypothetical protein